MNWMDICSLNGHIFLSWGKPFDKDGKTYQERECMGCKMVQRREVTVEDANHRLST